MFRHQAQQKKMMDKRQKKSTARNERRPCHRIRPRHLRCDGAIPAAAVIRPIQIIAIKFCLTQTLVDPIVDETQPW